MGLNKAEAARPEVRGALPRPALPVTGVTAIWTAISDTAAAHHSDDGANVATVLCLEDHTVALASRKSMLQKHGYTVLCASDTDTAIDLFAENPVDAVVLDCHWEEARRIATLLKTLRPELPIIMLSAYCGIPCKRRHDADACIQKGEAVKMLLEALARLTQPGSGAGRAA